MITHLFGEVVSQERQDEHIADTTAKAQPGAKIGPFTLGGKID